MFKQSLLLGAISGILAGIASVIYQKVYSGTLGADFAALAKPLNIVITCFVSGLIIATGYWLSNKWFKTKGEIIFNLVFAILSFASILPAFAFKLPLDIEMPELFPGLVVPMHFFPALAWFTLKPLFIKTYEPYNKVFA
ncbi:MAG: hypothetical protein H7Z13_08710 [Ferruginibacter sp.]|nr:hypothetical protein [Ferruginibacter sp.]